MSDDHGFDVQRGAELDDVRQVLDAWWRQHPGGRVPWVALDPVPGHEITVGIDCDRSCGARDQCDAAAAALVQQETGWRTRTFTARADAPDPVLLDLPRHGSSEDGDQDGAREWLARRGLDVRDAPASRWAGPARPTHDLEVVGVPVALRTLSHASPGAVERAVRSGQDAAPHLVVDGRSAGLRRWEAEQGVQRVFARHLDDVEELLVIVAGNHASWAGWPPGGPWWAGLSPRRPAHHGRVGRP